MTDSDEQEYLKAFYSKVEKETEKSQAIIAVELMLEIIKSYSEETMIELQKTIRQIMECLIQQNLNMSVVSGCEQFVRYITLAPLEQPNIDECKRILISRGHEFLNRCYNAKTKISYLGQTFIQNGAKILVHSRSRVVLSILTAAKNDKKTFHVYITEGQPDKAGKIMRNWLKMAGISSTLIMDSAVGFIIERIDMVLLGCQGVVESGGIINKIGSYQIALISNAKNVPVFVAAESYKFVRLFPLRQSDIPNPGQYEREDIDIVNQHPRVDYTPPSFINYLITNLGILTPNVVSDELMHLYT